MNYNEFKERLSELEKEYECKKTVLYKQYAMENNPVKVGDVITDHTHTIKVEKINFQLGFLEKVPTCIYYGTELTKKGTIKKVGIDNRIYQSNLKLINGVQVQDKALT